MRPSRFPILLLLLFLLGFPRECPAPLVYRPGEGWTYETPGGEGKWTRDRAKDQLEVAEQAFAAEDNGLAMKAARRVVKVWPQSDYAARGQYLVARCYEAKGNDERAFKEYQKLLERYPKYGNYQEILERQFTIANKYLAGKWFRLWGVLPLYPSMQKTVQMYEKIVRNGPFSPVGPAAQMNIGAAHEKQANFFNRVDPFREAVEAYEKAADVYSDNKKVASDALFKAGMAYYRQAGKADYDQSVANQAYETFRDFLTLYPYDPRVAEAHELMTELRTEQARGSVSIARYYQKKQKWLAAMIYYNEAYDLDPGGPHAEEARQQLDALRAKVGAGAEAVAAPTNAPVIP